jgi:hypothetical protein
MIILGSAGNIVSQDMVLMNNDPIVLRWQTTRQKIDYDAPMAARERYYHGNGSQRSNQVNNVLGSHLF